MKTTQMSVRGVPADLHKAMKLRAVRDGRTLNSIVLEALTQWWAQEERK